MGVVAEHSDRQSIRDVICHAGAGASAGAMAATFVCPLDVIKTRLQVHGMPSGQRGSIIVTSLQKILKTEGVKGMYRGLSPTILALLPNWAVYFTVYEQLKGLLHSHVHGSGELTIGENMIAAAGAGAATAISTNPLWVVKTRLQTQGMRPGVIPYKSMRSAFSRITTEEGLRGLYSGILPSLAGVSHVAIQFPAYEKIKSFMAKRDNTTVDKLHPSRVAFASSVSKVIASVITYPHEVVRSRLQEQGQARHIGTQYAGVIDCIKKVFQKEGLRGFYNGCATNLIRTTPSAVITFTSAFLSLSLSLSRHRYHYPQISPVICAGSSHPFQSETLISSTISKPLRLQNPLLACSDSFSLLPNSGQQLGFSRSTRTVQSQSGF